MSSDDDDDPWWIKPLAKIIVAVVFFLCAFLWEFTLNPSNNSSFEVTEGQAMVVEGLTCHNEPDWVYMAVVDTYYKSEKSRAMIRVWKSGDLYVRDFEVIEREDLKLENCDGEKISVAYIWSVSTMQTPAPVHFRVHPGFTFRLADATIP